MARRIPQAPGRGRGPSGAFLCTVSVCVALAILLSAQAPLRAEPRLERVVTVSRHGVRAPTAAPAALEARTGRPWPAFPVEPGEMTPHGAEALSRMGAYLRSVYARAELLPETGCPPPNAVQVWADGATNRTLRSGQVLAEAVAPGCGLVARHGPVGASDPVFDGGRVCPLDPAAALAAVQARTAGGTAVTDRASEKAIAALKRILGPAACKAVPAACLDGPSTLGATPTGPKIEGPLALAAAVSENLLLEYAQGLPADQVAWGQGTPETLAALLPAHRRAADLLHRTPEIAAFHGATLLRMLADLLQGVVPRGLGVPPLGASARLVVLAGHDTTLSTLSGALGLGWSLPGQPDPTAPGATLAFEVWRSPETSARTIRVRIYAQTLDQLRSARPLGPLDPPVSLPLTIGICPARDGGCDLETFVAKVRAALPPVCVR
ncbi:histidine-type phosphatase [Methylobacterium sp. J-026]|uniref:histidine-type phosphatase n=1 Tax=Methylobacterium sp. J-026 TaxID=2836624 RepID=UPI001FB9683B|nr:histidine-type phosphatase [Methylobacterium sp. J-026]MCJ2137617.1 histidine-type phosphatase [Methylobacterium sp. J-026]